MASYLAGLRITKRNISATILADVKRFFHQINTDEVFGTHRCAPRLSLSPARSRHQVHPVLPSDHCIRPGRAARATCLQPEPECLCGALGQVGEGGVPVQGDPLWRALAAASPERICRTFPCRTESPREGQCPAVPSECEHPPRRACSMPRATGRTLALLPSGGGVNGGGASDEFFDLTGSNSRIPPRQVACSLA